MLVVMAGLFDLMLHNSRINKAQKMTMDLQANARATLSVLVQKLRSAGWDPINAGIPVVVVDPDLSDAVSQIEVYADLNADGDTDDDKEQILLRHQGRQVEWRPTSDVGDPFVTVAVNISNDADGDGTPEAMFVPNSLTSPTRITVQVTAESAMPDPLSGEFKRYTVSSDVVLRKRLE
jgi:hypothetical protein